MIKVVCENCKIEMEIPDNYNAPFIQCPDCGSIQKLNRNNNSNEPKFKILDEKGRERAANFVVGEEYVEVKPQQKILKPKQDEYKKPDFQIFKMEASPEEQVLNVKQALIDSIGDNGLNKAYSLASKYINSSSDKTRKNGRAKAVQELMKEFKIPVELATKAIQFAEKADETQAISSKSKNINIIIIVAVVILVMIAGLIALSLF